MSLHSGTNEQGGVETGLPASGPSSTPLSFLRITPGALLGSRRSRRIVERNMVVYRRGWILLVSGFFEPFFYLLSIGIGLNTLVGPLEINGVLVPFTAFVAPGLLASSAASGRNRRSRSTSLAQ